MTEDYAEPCVLGAILLKPRLVKSVRGALGVSDFSTDKHRTVFRAICALDDQGIPPDLPAVGQHILTSGETERVGGPIGLSELVDGIPAHDDLSGFIRMVKRLSIDRRIQQTSDAMQAALEDGELPSDVLAEYLPQG